MILVFLILYVLNAMQVMPFITPNVMHALVTVKLAAMILLNPKQYVMHVITPMLLTLMGIA